MKSLKSFLECEIGCNAATPGNTLGMGNPGVIDNMTLSEPIKTKNAKAKKEKPKKLQESILDDEEVLINKAEEDSKNPFIVIGNLIVASSHLAKDNSTQQAIDKIIRNELVEYLPDIFKTSSWASKKGLVINYYGSTVSIKWGSDSNVEFLTIRGGYQDYKAVVYLLDSYHMEQVKSFGFKNKTQYEKWVKEFMKKFDLTPTPHDMFIGTI